MSELHPQGTPIPIRQRVVDLACPNCAQDGFAVWEQIGDTEDHLVYASPDFHAKRGRSEAETQIICDCCGHIIRA